MGKKNNEIAKLLEMLNKKEIKKESKKESKKDSKNKKGFIPPTFQDIQNYCKERNSCVDAKKFSNQPLIEAEKAFIKYLNENDISDVRGE